jgi:hypothetical protein
LNVQRMITIRKTLRRGMKSKLTIGFEKVCFNYQIGFVERLVDIEIIENKIAVPYRKDIQCCWIKLIIDSTYT